VGSLGTPATYTVVSSREQRQRRNLRNVADWARAAWIPLWKAQRISVPAHETSLTASCPAP